MRRAIIDETSDLRGAVCLPVSLVDRIEDLKYEGNRLRIRKVTRTVPKKCLTRNSNNHGYHSSQYNTLEVHCGRLTSYSKTKDTMLFICGRSTFSSHGEATGTDT